MPKYESIAVRAGGRKILNRLAELAEESICELVPKLAQREIGRLEKLRERREQAA